MCISNTEPCRPRVAKRVALPFREAGTAHHRAFAATNRNDPAWYATYLAPHLANLAGVPPSVHHLVADLVIVGGVHGDPPVPEY